MLSVAHVRRVLRSFVGGRQIGGVFVPWASMTPIRASIDNQHQLFRAATVSDDAPTFVLMIRSHRYSLLLVLLSFYRWIEKVALLFVPFVETVLDGSKLEWILLTFLVKTVMEWAFLIPT